MNATDIGLCSVVQHRAQTAHLSQVFREDSLFFHKWNALKLLIKTNRNNSYTDTVCFGLCESTFVGFTDLFVLLESQ